MDRSRVRCAVIRSIAEEQPVAGLAAHLQAERREARLVILLARPGATICPAGAFFWLFM